MLLTRLSSGNLIIIQRRYPQFANPKPISLFNLSMADFTDSTPPSTQLTRSLPVREDCWSEEATSTLIDAWGTRYIDLNRGNLRQKDWQEVADTVNSLHGHTKKTHRTDVQCKNRIDTIKKKYKTEKARVSSSNGVLTSSWIFYDRLDSLIGSVMASGKKATSPSSPPMALPLPYKKSPVPLAVALPQKRPASASDEGYFRRNYSAMAAAAAAAEVEDEEDDDEEEEEEDELERKSEDDERDEEGNGMRRLARAIEGFGEAYQRLEAEKLRQMVDLEKQRMQFAKDLEMQRMQMFMDTQVQLERLKNRKRSCSNGEQNMHIASQMEWKSFDSIFSLSWML